MSVALAFRSSKLAFKSSKLGVRTAYYPCEIDYNETAYATYATWNNLGIISTGWPYSHLAWDEAYDLFTTDPVRAYSACVANVRTDHSHGNASGLGQNNEAAFAAGWRGFLKPAEVPGTVTSAFLRVYNAGCFRHTLSAAGIDADRWDGYIGILGDENYQLGVYWYVNDFNYDQRITLPDVRAMNNAAGNGVVAANMGRYTYMRNGYIDIPVPAAVLTPLSQYTGIFINLYWSWVSPGVVRGGYCRFCTGDYNDTGYQSRIDACAQICTHNLLAQNPQLYVS